MAHSGNVRNEQCSPLKVKFLVRYMNGTFGFGMAAILPNETAKDDIPAKQHSTQLSNHQPSNYYNWLPVTNG